MAKNNEALAKREQQSLSKEDISTLVSAAIIPKDTPEGTIRMFGRFCAESNLSPFKRQVHLIKRGDKFTIQTGIDGYRSIADRTGRYAGNDDYLFDEGLTEYQHISQKKNANPITATATVYKLVGGIRVPFSATARWTEYFPGESQGFMWKKMPYLMLGKTAEALALRKAFPDELGGVYTDEEMAQAEVRTVERVQAEAPTESRAVEVAQGVNLNEFDPANEAIPFGKYSGVVWKDVPRDYLQWLSGNSTKQETKVKADATLKYLESLSSQVPPQDDFNGAFDEPDPLEVLEHSLDEVARSKDVAKLEEWWRTHVEEIKKLSKPAQTAMTKAFAKAKKEAE